MVICSRSSLKMASVVWIAGHPAYHLLKLLLGLLPANLEERLSVPVLWCACDKLCLHSYSQFLLNLWLLTRCGYGIISRNSHLLLLDQLPAAARIGSCDLRCLRAGVLLQYSELVQWLLAALNRTPGRLNNSLSRIRVLRYQAAKALRWLLAV